MKINHIYVQVVIQLATIVNGKWLILWNNPFVNSPYSVRPVSLELKRENEHAQIVADRIWNEIINLDDTYLSSGQTVIFQAFMALCDQKGLDVFLGGEGSANCPLCGATPTQMSTKGFKFKPIKSLAKLLLCLSQLHYGLACLRFVLCMGYHQDFKEATVGGKKDGKPTPWSLKKKEFKKNRITTMHDNLFKR